MKLFLGWWKLPKPIVQHVGGNLSSRLNEIRDAVQMETGPHDAQQRAAFAKVQQWLKQGQDDAAIALSAAQLLLVDADLTTETPKRASAPVRTLLEEEWGNLAKPNERTRALQVLVLAAWEPRMNGGGYLALPLVSSVWALGTRHPQLLPFITELLTSFFGPTPTKTAPAWVDIAGSKPATTKVVFDEAVKAEIAGMTPPGIEKLTALLGQLSTVSGGLRVESEALRSGLNRWGSLAAASLRELTARSEIVWWGQARYSEYARKPFRQLSDGAKRWWAAYELSRLAGPHHCEVAASFLVETLRDVGVNPDETRTLGEWLRDLQLTLNENRDRLPRTSSVIASRVEECAAGLPVSWLRSIADAQFSADDVRNYTGLDASTIMTSWQWTSCVLRESLLEQLLE